MSCFKHLGFRYAALSNRNSLPASPATCEPPQPGLSKLLPTPHSHRRDVSVEPGVSPLPTTEPSSVTCNYVPLGGSPASVMGIITVPPRSLGINEKCLAQRECSLEGCRCVRLGRKDKTQDMAPVSDLVKGEGEECASGRLKRGQF